MRRLLTLGLLLLAVACAGAAAPAAAEVREGRLRILAGGREIGREHYQINTTATEMQARGEVELEVGADKLRQRTSLLLSGDATPRRYEWRMEVPNNAWVRVEFDGRRATVTFPREDGKEEQQLYDFESARVAVVDVNVFHHFLLLARLYDFATGGPQQIPVLIPQAVQPGMLTVELEEVEKREVEGRSQAVRRLSITSEDNRVLLWVTDDGRFARLEVPQAGVEVLPEEGAR